MELLCFNFSIHNTNATMSALLSVQKVCKHCDTYMIIFFVVFLNIKAI